MYIPRFDLVETKYKKGSKEKNIVILLISSLDSILKIQENILGFDNLRIVKHVQSNLYFSKRDDNATRNTSFYQRLNCGNIILSLKTLLDPLR